MRRSLCGVVGGSSAQYAGDHPPKRRGASTLPASRFPDSRRNRNLAHWVQQEDVTPKARDRQHSSVTLDLTGVDNLVTQGDCEIKSFLQKDLKLPRLSEYHHFNCQIWTRAKKYISEHSETLVTEAASESDKGRSL